jgi:hypothetical protein
LLIPRYKRHIKVLSRPFIFHQEILALLKNDWNCFIVEKDKQIPINFENYTKTKKDLCTVIAFKTFGENLVTLTYVQNFVSMSEEDYCAKIDEAGITKISIQFLGEQYTLSFRQDTLAQYLVADMKDLITEIYEDLQTLYKHYKESVIKQKEKDSQTIANVYKKLVDTLHDHLLPISGPNNNWKLEIFKKNQEFYVRLFKPVVDQPWLYDSLFQKISIENNTISTEQCKEIQCNLEMFIKMSRLYETLQCQEDVKLEWNY